MELDLKTEYEAAQMLGLSVRTLQAMRVRGSELPYVKLGKAVRYRGADLLSYIEKSTVRPPAEADHEGEPAR